MTTKRVLVTAAVIVVPVAVLAIVLWREADGVRERYYEAYGVKYGESIE